MLVSRTEAIESATLVWNTIGSVKWVLTFARINKKCVLIKMSGVGIIKGCHRLKHATMYASSSRFHETCIRVSLPAFLHRSRATHVAACIVKPRNRCTHVSTCVGPFSTGERRTSATSSNSWCLGSRQVHNSKASDDGAAALLDVCCCCNAARYRQNSVWKYYINSNTRFNRTVDQSIIKQENNQHFLSIFDNQYYQCSARAVQFYLSS